MKKILIVSHGMEIGGAERALLGLLENIDVEKYRVDLFLARHSGELMKYIPETINLLPESKQYSCLAVPIMQVLKKKQINVALGRVIGKNRAKKRVKQLNLPKDNDIGLQYSHKYTLPTMPLISKEEYDLAISFLTPHYFVTEKVRAKKKIAWIHTDYSVVATDKEEQLRMWEKYDVIASISDNVTKSFFKVFPELQPKIRLIANIMPVKYMEILTNEFDATVDMNENDTIKLLSIGRFCAAKNFDNVPFICKNLLEKGVSVKWYIIGYGRDEMLIREKIIEAGMQNHVIVLGKKENPYPYIKACDIYVQPSRYEGKCVSVIEAQMLHKPVIITNYSTSKSQLKNGIDGVIVPGDNKGCAEGILALIKDKKLQEKIVANTYKTDYSNKEEVLKIYEILEKSE